MILILLKIAAGYAAAAVVATLVLVAQMQILFGGGGLGWRETLGIFAFIGAFAWARLIFALWGERKGWTGLVTYLGGGLLAMALGVATVMALSAAQAVLDGRIVPDLTSSVSAINNAAQLLALGVLPGLAAGLTFWLLARPAPITA